MGQVEGSRLSEIEDKLRMRLEALAMYAHRAVKAAWHVGDLLVQAKAQVQHGGWLPWLERVGVDRRLAQRCMRLRDKYTLDGVQAHRSVDAALGAIAAPANATNLSHLEPDGKSEDSAVLPADDTLPRRRLTVEQEIKAVARCFSYPDGISEEGVKRTLEWMEAEYGPLPTLEEAQEVVRAVEVLEAAGIQVTA